MSPVRACGVKLAVSEIFLRVVPNGLDEVFKRFVGCRELRDQIQFRTLCAIGAVVLGKQDGQLMLWHQYLGLFCAPALGLSDRHVDSSCYNGEQYCNLHLDAEQLPRFPCLEKENESSVSQVISQLEPCPTLC